MSSGIENRFSNLGHKNAKCPRESSWEEVFICILQKQGDSTESKELGEEGQSQESCVHSLEQETGCPR